MEAAPVFASTAATAGLPPIPTPEQANAIAYGHANLAATADAVKQAGAWVEPLRREVGRVIIGQKYLVDRLLIALVANGHVLLEGVPGLAKTLALRTLAATIQLRFQRIQFTPDMLPADIVGTQIYNPRDGTFNPKLGPIFANFVLADEINRAPAKVQSALLESMQERQVTLGENTYVLPEPFLVMATQNPIEQEGTYPLPEAQVDRFMLKVVVNYPSRAEERGILDAMATTTPNLAVQPVVTPEQILQARQVINAIHVDDKVRDYIVDVVIATREPKTYNLDFPGWIQYGASPRATISLALAARALAFLSGRAYVTPQDVKDVAHDVLQHRVAVTYEAEAENLTSRDIVQKILDTLPVP
ncbi:MAG TPA: MoxR family ATPase [Candidatus Methylacidiphilales bacterium]|jgi:MoxR-like ATPase|nr:MoxR family ATPase [Candidatus Methylacidiphilales bacterium]